MMNRSRGLRIALVPLVALLGVLVTLLVLRRDSCPPLPKDGPGVSRIDLGAQVLHVAAGPKGIWAIRRHHGGERPYDLVELDPATGKIRGAPVKLPVHAGPLDVGTDAVWVTSFTPTKTPRGTLFRVDPAAHRIVSQLPLERAASSVSVGEGGVWVAIPDANMVVRIDPTGRRVVTRVPVEDGPDLVLARGGAVWVSNRYASAALHRIDPSTGRRTGDMEGRLANVGPDAVWVIGSGAPNGRLLRIDPTAVRPVGPALGLDILPATVGIAGRDVWVGRYFSYCDPRISGPYGFAALSVGWFRVDPSTMKPLSGPVHVGGNTKTPAFASGAFWIAPDDGKEVIRIDLATAGEVRPA